MKAHVNIAHILLKQEIYGATKHYKRALQLVNDNEKKHILSAITKSSLTQSAKNT